MRYRSIDRRRGLYSVRMMCRLLRVSRSGYYAWRTRPESTREKTDRHLTHAIKRVHADSKGTYGSPRIRAELKSQGLHYGRHKVARLMHLAGIKGCPQRRYKVTTQSDSTHRVAHNLLKQDFVAASPDQRWASDTTYISTQQGWLFLAVVMDLYSRRIVGWSMDRWNSGRLVMDALLMALAGRHPQKDMIHHSDRGAQYTSDEFRNELKRNGIRCSMSARANCYDNAAVESFFGLLKRECVNRVRFRTRDEARATVFEYIEVFYNRKRRHGYLGHVSPVDFENRTLRLN